MSEINARKNFEEQLLHALLILKTAEQMIDPKDEDKQYLSSFMVTANFVIQSMMVSHEDAATRYMAAGHEWVGR